MHKTSVDIGVVVAEIDRAIGAGGHIEFGPLQSELFGGVETLLATIGQDCRHETWAETADRLAEVSEQLRIADDRWGIIENNL